MKEFEKLESYLKGLQLDGLEDNPSIRVLVERPQLNTILVQFLRPLFESIDPNYFIASRIPLIGAIPNNWTITFKMLELAFEEHLGSNFQEKITDKKNLFPKQPCTTGGCMPVLASGTFEAPLSTWLEILNDSYYAPHKSKQLK
jgi:hypothetical protein